MAARLAGGNPLRGTSDRMYSVTWSRWWQEVSGWEFAWLCANGVLLLSGFVVEFGVRPFRIGAVIVMVGVLSNVGLTLRQKRRQKANASKP